jgi:ABC-type phosphate transport system substrate-binding protein
MIFTHPLSKRRPRGFRGWRRLAVGLALLVAAVGAGATGDGLRAESAMSYRIIVNPTYVGDAVDRAFIAQAFLKKVHRWPNGDAIQPVDLNPGSATRRQWSTEYLGRSVQAVKSYWQQMIFSGRDLPPPEIDRDDDVVSYVLRKQGGIGYVSAGTNVRGAKVLVVRP